MTTQLRHCVTRFKVKTVVELYLYDHTLVKCMM